MHREPAGGAIAPNPLGIHYLKFALALSVIATHSVVWICEETGFRFNIQNDLITKILTLALSGPLVPMTAGAVQALSLRDQFREGRLEVASLRPFFSILLFLAFLESFKAMIVYGPSIFFGWNALHLIAASLAIVLLLARKSIHWVSISAVACLALTPAVRSLVSGLQIERPETMHYLNEIGLSKTILYVLGAILAIFTARWLAQTTKVAPVYKKRLAFLGLAALAAYSWGVFISEPEFYFAIRILHLPAGALVGDGLGLHYWPLFPWYSTVAFGFVLYYYLERVSRPGLVRIGLGLASLGAIWAHFSFGFDGILAEMSKATLWSDRVFRGSLWMVLFVCSLFVALTLFYEALARSKWMARLIGRAPLVHRVPVVYSKTIFWSYLFVNTFGILLAYPFAKALPVGWALVAYPVFCVLAWYWIGESIISWFEQKRISIKLRPAA